MRVRRSVAVSFHLTKRLQFHIHLKVLSNENKGGGGEGGEWFKMIQFMNYLVGKCLSPGLKRHYNDRSIMQNFSKPISYCSSVCCYDAVKFYVPLVILSFKMPKEKPGFRIRIDLMRIRIPDPAFFLIADPDFGSRIRIQGLMTKN